MVRGAYAAIGAALVLAGLSAAPAQAVVIDLELSPGDFIHSSEYRADRGTTRYSESIAFSAPAGIVNPGDAVSVRLTFEQSIQVENFYPGTIYTADIALRRGPYVSGFGETFSPTLTLTDPDGLSITVHGGYGNSATLGGVELIEHTQSASLEPIASFGRVGGVEWTYIAPDWTPTGSELQLQFALDFFTRAVDEPLADPGRHLITFVPEPATAMLVLPALALATRPRRRLQRG